MPATESPLALIGYPVGAARMLRELGLVGVSVPSDDLSAVLAACQTLKFCGALIHASQEVHALDSANPDRTARRAGRVDAVAFAGGPHGTFALADALTDLLEASGYATRGASAVLIGQDAHDLALALPLTRLGFTDVGIVAESTPDAERAIRDLPAGLRSFPMSRRDPALGNLTERADLIVLTGGSLPAGVAQPYHTLIDLTSRANPQNDRAQSSGATLLDLSDLPARHLARQLAHATGQRFRVEELQSLVPSLE